MLIPAFSATSSARDYARFISTLTWYRMYCVAQLGASKDDYVLGFNKLKDRYEDLFHYEEEQPYWAQIGLSALLEEIHELFSENNLTNEHISQMATLLYDFETMELIKFEKRYFEYQNQKILEEWYSNELYNAVHDLRSSNQDESAIMAAFKFLDSQLQILLNVDTNRYYGEDLINYAFSPNSGVLQVKGHPNEQIGIRNFYSGANAIFRNPSAHRFVKYDGKTADAIIAMVAMMANLAGKMKDISKS